MRISAPMPATEAQTPEQARMRLRRKPIRPKWNPLYALRDVRIERWLKFVSEAHWNVALE